MTYQPPPSGGTPPPPPGYGPSGGNRSSFDPKSVNPLDWALVGIGALLLIFSFFDYYTFKGCVFNTCVSLHYSAWHTGGGTWLAWLAMLVGVAGGVFVALELFASVRLSVSNRLIALGLFAVSFLLYVIAIFAHSSFGPNGGHGFSFWLSLILAAAGTVLALMRAQQTGTQLPGRLNELPNIGARGPQGGLGGSTPSTSGYGAPPAAGYAPPPPAGYAPPPAPSAQPPAPSAQPPTPGTGSPPPPQPQQPPQGFGQPPQ